MASLQEKFDRAYQASEYNARGCLIWAGDKGRSGYGRVQHRGTSIPAHRLALAAHLGRPIAPGMLACHICDNPACVNPKHLYEGSHRDNSQDMIKRGRQRPQSRGSKLTSEQASEIIEALRAGEARSVIAKRYGVSYATVTKIALGQRWGRLQKPS